MIEYIPQALSSLSAATKIISSLLSLQDFSKYAPRLNELLSSIIKANEMIITAQQHESSLTAKIQELEKEAVRLKDWNAEKENYSLQQIAHGVFARVEKKGMNDFQSAHKLCCNCFNKSIPSTLQQQKKRGEGGWHFLLIFPNVFP